MNALIKNLLIGAATLAVASAPLAASAQDWHNDHDRDNHARIVHRDVRYDNNHRPVYGRSYHEGYYGYAPGGFSGYYHSGRWFHHRSQQAGIWIYF